MVYPAVELPRSWLERHLCRVVNARFVVPFDTDAVAGLLEKAPVLVLEENVEDGGFGEQL